ncbi:hypothetical protein PTTG_30009, partial [Puccinia triticina 1-1 BBBD Race 1]
FFVSDRPNPTPANVNSSSSEPVRSAADPAPTDNGVAALFDLLFRPTGNTARAQSDRVVPQANQANKPRSGASVVDTGLIAANINPALSAAGSTTVRSPALPAVNPILRRFIDSIHNQAPPAPQSAASTQLHSQSVASTEIVDRELRPQTTAPTQPHSQSIDSAVLVDQELRGGPTGVNPTSTVHPCPASRADTEIIVEGPPNPNLSDPENLNAEEDVQFSPATELIIRTHLRFREECLQALAASNYEQAVLFRDLAVPTHDTLVRLIGAEALAHLAED